MLIREIHEGDYSNLTALAIQVWLHTYAKDGIRNEISGFVLSEFHPEYFRRIHESKSRHIHVAELDNHLITSFRCVERTLRAFPLFRSLDG